MNKLISMGGVEPYLNWLGEVNHKRVAHFEKPFKVGRRHSAHVLLSYVPCPMDTRRPETLAFICDEDGDVMDWGELCASYAPDHETGMAECVEMLEAM